MKKMLWITTLVIVAAFITACGGGQPTEAPTEAPQVQPTTAPTQAEAQPAEEEQPAQPASDDPAAIFKAAMAGVQTNVEPFFEGVPLPEGATIQFTREDRVEFITTLTVAEATQWYRDTFTSLGLIEVTELTKEADFGSTTYWGGYPDGRAIIVKITRQTPASTKVVVSFEDL